jgi:hypothetical protein
MRYSPGQVLRRPDTLQGGHATHLVGWNEQRGVFFIELIDVTMLQAQQSAKLLRT